MTICREFLTSAVVDIKFNLSEFSMTKEIKLNFNIFNNKSKPQHDMIIRIEALDEFSIVLNFDKNFIKQNNS